MINKAVILARGLGRRLKKSVSGLNLDERTEKLADEGLKGLITINKEGKTLLDYSIERLINTGYTQICLVVAPEHEEFKKYYSKREADITFAIQQEPKGTAEAVYSAKSFAGKDSFIMLNSDNLYSENALTALKEPEKSIWYCIGYDRKGLIEKSNIPPDKIKKFGIIIPSKPDKNGDIFLEDIKEKEKRPEDYAVSGKILVSMNLFRFTPEIFTACENTELSERGEKEITSSVQYGLTQLGMKMKIFYVNEGVLDLTSGEDILSIRKILKYS